MIRELVGKGLGWSDHPVNCLFSNEVYKILALIATLLSITKVSDLEARILQMYKVLLQHQKAPLIKDQIFQILGLEEIRISKIIYTSQCTELLSWSARSKSVIWIRKSRSESVFRPMISRAKSVFQPRVLGIQPIHGPRKSGFNKSTRIWIIQQYGLPQTWSRCESRLWPRKSRLWIQGPRLFKNGDSWQ
jgi:hypothetical protein